MMINSKAAMTAGAAFLALIAAPPIYAQSNGNDNGAGGASAQKAQRANSGGQGVGGIAGKSDRNGSSSKKRDAPAGGTSAGAAQPGNAKQAAGTSNARSNAQDDRRAGNSGKSNQGEGGGKRGVPVGSPGGLEKISGVGGYALRELRDTFGSRPRLIDGCPPGLARKRNGCLPPGLAQNRYRTFDPGFFGLRGADRGRYLYQDGYLLRYRPDGLAGFLPLLGGALGIGNVWPASYQSAPLPAYYKDYYRLGDDRSYRYADNVIYRVNPETAAITSVAGLLTGDDIAIGQPIPRGYDVYNVPLAYRDRYSDTPQARYRYANGYVYEIDPRNSLVASAIALVL